MILFINKTTLTMKFSAALTLLLLTGTTNAFVNEQFASPSTRTFLGSTSTELSERKAFMTGNWKLNPQTKVRVIKSVVSCRVALFLVWFGLVSRYRFSVPCFGNQGVEHFLYRLNNPRTISIRTQARGPGQSMAIPLLVGKVCNPRISSMRSQACGAVDGDNSISGITCNNQNTTLWSTLLYSILVFSNISFPFPSRRS